MEKFWIVMLEESAFPTWMKHPNTTRAEEEAQRLARETGKKVYVLEALGYFEVPAPQKLPWVKLGYG